MRLTAKEIAAIPRPQTEAEYAACYRANVVEARDKLHRALQRFDALKQVGHITEKADREAGYIFANDDAKKAHGDVVRWRSDLEHWHARMVEAERQARAEAVQEPDSRLPPERDPEPDNPPQHVEDEEVPF